MIAGPVANDAQEAFVVSCERSGLWCALDPDDAFPASVYRLRVRGPGGATCWVNVLPDGTWCSPRAPRWAARAFGDAYAAASAAFARRH
jgi:hypothetical protein